MFIYIYIYKFTCICKNKLQLYFVHIHIHKLSLRIILAGSLQHFYMPMNTRPTCFFGETPQRTVNVLNSFRSVIAICRRRRTARAAPVRLRCLRASHDRRQLILLRSMWGPPRRRGCKLHTPLRFLHEDAASSWRKSAARLRAWPQ